MLVDIETATKRKLPVNFASILAGATLRRLRSELRATTHVEHALTWLRGPKCVASSSPLDRVRLSLESTGLLRFFDPYLFSASDVPRGKPAPDLFLYAAAKMHVEPADCIVVEDSPAGVAAAYAAGMSPIGFIGGSHPNPTLGAPLTPPRAPAPGPPLRALKTPVLS